MGQIPNQRKGNEKKVFFSLSILEKPGRSFRSVSSNQEFLFAIYGILLIETIRSTDPEKQVCTLITSGRLDHLHLFITRVVTFWPIYL